MGPSQAPVVAFSAKLTPSGADVAAMSNRSGEFGRCCADMQNVQITTAGNDFWHPGPGEHAPAEAVPD